MAYLNEHKDAADTKRAVEREGRRCILLSGDVADPKFCKEAVKKSIDEFGKLDVLVNNAAFQEHVNKFEDLTEEHFDRTFKTNLYGYFHMAKAAVPKMKKGSSIVMTGSVTGLLGNKHLLDYSMTKGGIHAFTRSLATHLVDRGIRVNAVAPGSGLDSAQSRRQGCQESREVWQRHAYETARPARRDRTSLCVSGSTELLQLHHRRGSSNHRRIFARLNDERRTLQNFSTRASESDISVEPAAWKWNADRIKNGRNALLVLCAPNAAKEENLFRPGKA